MNNENEIFIETSLYDTEEIYYNCTVQILSNSVTGECSVGWWQDGDLNEERDGCNNVQ